MKGSLRAGERPLPSYSFHATNDPNADISAIRAELKEMSRKIEKTDWVNMPPGSVQIMMLGDHGQKCEAPGNARPMVSCRPCNRKIGIPAATVGFFPP
jgi:hypothetical protein